MRQAIHNESKTIVTASGLLDASDEYTCGHCRESVFLRQGQKIKAHFAHHNHADVWCCPEYMSIMNERFSRWLECQKYPINVSTLSRGWLQIASFFQYGEFVFCDYRKTHLLNSPVVSVYVRAKQRYTVFARTPHTPSITGRLEPNPVETFHLFDAWALEIPEQPPATMLQWLHASGYIFLR